MYIRAINQSDVGALFTLARHAPPGLTSLPENADILAERIAQSVTSQTAETAENWQRLLLVLFDPISQEIAGVSGLEREEDTTSFHYEYRDAATLPDDQRSGAGAFLHLSSATISTSKLGSLYLKNAFRGNGYGQLLSTSRFLYIADAQRLIGPDIHAELRGISKSDGAGPFWQDIGHHFYQMDFATADKLRGSAPMRFAEASPAPHDVPLSLVGTAAQESIGQVHPDTRNALRILQREGFRKTPYVDIMDGGPIVSCAVRNILTVRKSITCLARHHDHPKGDLWLLSNHNHAHFRACMAPAEYDEFHLRIDDTTMAALDIIPGDIIRAVPK
ncbi:arginine N-succinyltransferase [Acidithiobacillus ferrianus]|uniref:Arginine N-succinyltransferase n=2 Tax=Acidithiobacillus ferrianus TaxID=2678518 RepID=A0A845UB09_9PROT|nr:arginine N-succinyltransferase [Acidithiobacillus ferrianus]NDU42957.1 hypothetical protein [Acidithiobacillus ferrianus]